MELVITLPVNHPLGVVAVDCGKRVGVPANLWRNWMLQMTTFLTHQVYTGREIAATCVRIFVFDIHAHDAFTLFTWPAFGFFFVFRQPFSFCFKREKNAPKSELRHAVPKVGLRAQVLSLFNLVTRHFMFVFPQNGSMLDGLALWKRNVDKKFAGVEECMVCFSVIHPSNYHLPKLQCKVCKKKFHSACLVSVHVLLANQNSGHRLTGSQIVSGLALCSVQSFFCVGKIKQEVITGGRARNVISSNGSQLKVDETFC